MSEQGIEYRIKESAYQGASTHYRLEQIGLLEGDQDTVAQKELHLLRQRSHHATRNNGWASALRDKYKIEQGIVKVVWKTKDGKVHKAMQKYWEEFSENPNQDGYGTLANTLESWNVGEFESGEALTRMIIQQRPGFKIPLVLQNIEAEQLNELYNDEEKNIKLGMRFSKNTPVTYYFNKHINKQAKAPFSVRFATFSEKDVIPVPAEDIIHIFKRNRPSQWRGIPILAPVLISLYDVEDLSDATINKQKNSQVLSWVITKGASGSPIAIGTPGQKLDEEGNTTLVSQTSTSNVAYLNRDEAITPIQGQDIGDGLEILLTTELRKIAQATGFSYQLLTGDLSQISFSGLKYLINEAKQKAEYNHLCYTINLGLKPLCARFKALASIYIKSNTSNAIPTFNLPRRYSTDELKDGQADILELMMGLGLWQEKLSSRGLTPEEVKQDREVMKAAGVVLPESVPASEKVKPKANSSSI